MYLSTGTGGEWREADTGKVILPASELAVLALRQLEAAMTHTTARMARRHIREAERIIQAIQKWADDPETDQQCPKCGADMVNDH